MTNPDILTRLRQSGFTPEEEKLLMDMARGDNNNKKGRFYEECFTIFQVLKFTTQKDIANSDIFISNNEESYVDDLQIVYKHDNQECKRNFQLKNSPTTGKWNQDLQKIFDLQKKYNDAIHPNKQSVSYLICSDKDIIKLNSKKNITNCVSEFYPYHSTISEMLKDDETQLTKLLKEVCPDKTQHDTAMRLLLLPTNNSEEFNYPLDKWWDIVKESSKPNIFSLTSWSFPESFKECCERYNFCIQADIIYFNGLQFTITENLVQKIQSESCQIWHNINTQHNLLCKIMELSTI